MRHLEEIRRTKEQIKLAGYYRRRDLNRHLRNLYRELRIYDEFMKKGK